MLQISCQDESSYLGFIAAIARIKLLRVRFTIKKLNVLINCFKNNLAV